MTNKSINMLNVWKITVVLGLTSLIIACGGGKSGNADLEAKQKELQQLKADQNKLNQSILKVQAEIALLDSNAAVKPKLVSVLPLTSRSFTHYIDLQGHVDAEDISYISPRGMGGQVKALFIKQGDYVKKGDLVLKLDDALARQGVANARQGVEGVKTQLELARNLYQRQKNLWDQGIGTEVQLLQAKNNVDALQNQLKQAEEGVKLAEEQLAQTNVISDVSGIADLVNIKVGELFQGATAAGPQIRVVNTSNLKAVVEVPENYLSSVKKGTPVVIEIGDVGKSFNSTVFRVGQVINANSRAVLAEAKIPSDAAIKPNQLARIKIRDYSASSTIVIPMITIQSDIDGKYVYVLETVNGKQLARRQPVEVGQIYGEEIEVKSGLKAGDQLISQGFQSVYDGQAVTTQE